MSRIEEKYATRSAIASLQKLLSESAKKGDPAAVKAYADAAYELSLLVKALLTERSKTVPVTLSGGIFKNGSLILGPLEGYLKEEDVCLKEAEYSPVEGAVLMACREKDMKSAEKVLSSWKNR
jgi:N-acetylglucosamine kinase-like BadF-type ATPase